MKTQTYCLTKRLFHNSILISLLVFSIFSVAIGQTNINTQKIFTKAKDRRAQQAGMPIFTMPVLNKLNEITYPAEGITESDPNPGNQIDAPLATRTASVSGNWNSTSTWGGSAVPTSSDAVSINSGITVTVNIANAQCASLTFASVNSNSVLTVSGTNSLAITGALIMPRPSSGNVCTLNVNAGTITCGSLTMSATTTTRNDIINITTGTLTISGALTTGTTGCQIIFTGAGTLNMGGTMSSTPTITTVAGSTVNYTGASAQTIYAISYNGNLGASGAGAKTIASTKSISVLGNFTNSGTFTVTDGTTTTDTWFSVGGNFTNSGTFTEAGVNSRFMLNGTTAQTFTNTGAITSSLSEFGLANPEGVIISTNSNQIVVARADLFYGTVTNSNKLTFGTGSTSSSTIQRGVSTNVYPAGGLDQSPIFNVGSGGLYLLYDNGSTGYNTGFEVPATSTADAFYIFDAADITMNSDLTISDELNFYGGTGTPTLRIGANTLTLGGGISYTVAGAFFGGATSNLVLNGTTTVNTITNGLNNLTVNANTTLGGAITVNGSLFLSSGLLINGSNLTMASGTTISRSGGNVNSAPTFAGTVNLDYSGSTPLNTGKELPTGSAVLNNLTTNTGGVTQYDFSTSTTNLLNDAFSNLTSWTGNKGTAAGQFNSVATATAGGTSPEATFIGSSSHGNSTYYINRGPINTNGYSSVNISFKTATSAYYTPTATTYLKLQTATSASGPWHDAWSLLFTAQLSARTISIPNHTMDVGGNLYIQFAYVGDYYALDNWWIDNLLVNGVSITPIASTATVNGVLDLTSGSYTIGSNNTLTLNGSLSGSSDLIGSTSSNLSVGGSGANLILPNIANGLDNFTITRPNGVSIASDKDLTVGGTLANSVGNAGLVIKSDANGSGSLIHSTSGVPATVERYIANNWKWHFLSSPVSAQAIWPEFVPDPGSGLNFGTIWNWDFYYWNTNSSLTSALFWVNLRKNTAGDYNNNLIDQPGSYAGFGTATPPEFTIGRGYLAAYNSGWNPATGSPTIHSFMGTLNTGTVNRAIVAGANSFNLVGNPYASAIDWKASSGWSRSSLVLNGSGYDYWIFNDNAGNYGVFNSTGTTGTNGVSQYIAPEQAFFVKASADGTLGMNNSIRVHNAQSWLKAAESDQNSIRLEITTTANAYSDEMIIDFNPAIAEGGSEKFWSLYSEAPEIYSVKDGNSYSIDRYYDLENGRIVNLAAKTGVEGNYTITASNISDFSLSDKVFLEDMKTGVVTNLKITSSYSFAGSPGDDRNRFRLLIGTATGTEESVKNNFNVYASDNIIYVQNGKSTESYSVTVTNMIGQVINEFNAIKGATNRIELKAVPGVYIVSIRAKGQSYSAKVILH